MRDPYKLAVEDPCKLSNSRDESFAKHSSLKRQCSNRQLVVTEPRKIRGIDSAQFEHKFPNKKAAQRGKTLEKKEELLVLKNLRAGSLFS